MAIGDHAHVAPLRDGRVASDRLAIEFVDIAPLPRAFRQFVRDDTIDIAELAVVTHLLACQYRRPIRGLAIPLWSRLPHTNLVCPAHSALSNPGDLAGGTVGVRAYAQTSGVWVRGVLQHEYGVDLDTVMWGTMEDAHLPEYRDPSSAYRCAPTPPLRDRMLAGEFDAIMGERVVDPRQVRSVIPGAEAAALAWIDRSGIQPINHILAARTEQLDAHPWLAKELMALFEEARRIAVADGAPPPPTYGMEACAASLQRCFDYSFEQAITPQRHAVADFFEPI